MFVFFKKWFIKIQKNAAWKKVSFLLNVKLIYFMGFPLFVYNMHPHNNAIYYMCNGINQLERCHHSILLWFVWNNPFAKPELDTDNIIKFIQSGDTHAIWFLDCSQNKTPNTEQIDIGGCLHFSICSIQGIL